MKKKRSLRSKAHLEEHVPLPFLLGAWKISLPKISGSLPWTRKVRQKLHRLEYPELTAAVRKNLTEGRWLARTLMADLRKIKNLRQSDEGKRIDRTVLQAVWEGDTSFLEEFTAGLKPVPDRRDNVVEVYDWLLSHAEEVEDCHTVAQIVESFPPDLAAKIKGTRPHSSSLKSFEKICREVGLPHFVEKKKR